MTNHLRSALHGFALAFLSLALAGGDVGAQTLHTSGQNVQPVFEGWQRNPDGTFTMVFGYLNRNYVEEPHVPVGPNNAFEPGPADRGQPTHFYPRRQSFVFEVTVPADWGDKELVWTMTHNGQTDQAYGSLSPSWEIDEGVWQANRGRGIAGITYDDPNRRPSITVVGDDTVTITLPETLNLTVSASDDGNPGPEPQTQRQQQRERPRGALSATGVPALRGGPNSQNMVKAQLASETGLAVSWIHYRGPGKVTFEPMAMPVNLTDGKAVTTVRFSEPGTYVLRAYADDGNLTTPADVTVIVKSAAPQVRR